MNATKRSEFCIKYGSRCPGTLKILSRFQKRTDTKVCIHMFLGPARKPSAFRYEQPPWTKKLNMASPPTGSMRPRVNGRLQKKWMKKNSLGCASCKNGKKNTPEKIIRILCRR